MTQASVCEIQVQDKGIHCGGCETRIQSVLGKVPGVMEVKTSQKTQKVDLVLDPDVVSLQDIKERLEDLGYSIG